MYREILHFTQWDSGGEDVHVPKRQREAAQKLRGFPAVALRHCYGNL
jgi:hypothetical protein